MIHFYIFVEKKTGPWCGSHGSDGSAEGFVRNAEEVDSGNPFRICSWCGEIGCGVVITFVIAISPEKGYKSIMQ